MSPAVAYALLGLAAYLAAVAFGCWVVSRAEARTNAMNGRIHRPIHELSVTERDLLVCQQILERTESGSLRYR